MSRILSTGEGVSISQHALGRGVCVCPGMHWARACLPREVSAWGSVYPGVYTPWDQIETPPRQEEDTPLGPEVDSP